MANVEVRGMDTLRRVLDNAGNLPPTLMRDLQQFVTQRAMAIEAEAVRRAPIDQGTLRRSSSTDVSLMGELRAQIMFGGMAAAYAEVQHEREDFRHDDGMDHFLHGAPHSAWEQMQDSVYGDIEAKATEIAEAVLELGL